MTFVYNYLTNFTSVKPFVYAQELQNLDQFGTDQIKRIRRYSLPWLLYQLGHKLNFDARFVQKCLFNVNNLRSVRSHLTRNDIRLLHSHIGPMGCHCLGLKKRMGLPLITTFYGIDVSFYARTGWREHYIPLFREGERFFAEGSHMKRCLVELGCPEQKIEIIHIAADMNNFQFRPRTLKDGEPITLLFCGRLVEKKGLAYALRALHIVKERFSNVQLRVIGDGPLRGDMERLVTTLQLDDFVKFLGYVPYEETKKEMARAHILVQPSVTASNGETEGGAPTVLIEAQACGMPILASLHADIPEVVLNEKSGLLSEERDFEQLADHMIFLLNHPEKWPEMGEAGRRHVEENYNIRIETRKIEDIYLELIGSS